MKAFVIFLIVLFPCVAWSYENTISGCPASSDVVVSFDFSSGNQTSVMYIGTNVEDRTLAPGLITSYGVSNIIIKGRSDASGNVELRSNLSSVVYTNITCVASSGDSGQGQYASFMIGGLCGLSFALAVASRS